ncbi:hypothetical protein HQ36_06185 [Porphyromonas gingivicanis]|uniref:Glycosyl transferase family 2 n=1 Tax=Porphyromonas gingivicanis TaxID=266762 RepID=A0A0A2G2I5_9PORP|nr:glycosyltransferase family 2 protein [Porphyromonas gingivicanis]KGN97483.1 hypothetical protein HQ36_06185 [Porphyromonas gingivicanis]
MSISSSHTYRIAAITMARNDLFFLERWIAYYGRELGEEHLYIYLDGEDQLLPSNMGKANIKHFPHKELARAEGDKYRIGLLNTLKDELLCKGYDMVIGTDADEFLVVDPARKQRLRDFLYQHRSYATISALGLDLGQKVGIEPNLNPSLSLLKQRGYAVLSSRYTKASILTQPLRWGSGFHRVKGSNFHILPDFYLLHTGYCDWERIQKRFADTARIEGGWDAHLKRRARTIYYVTHRKPIRAEHIFKRARLLQSLCRPFYALNKPMMPTPALVVALPSRFQTVEI